MATDYISPWGGMPRTGTNPLYGYDAVPQSVLDHFASYMSSGGQPIAYQDPNGLYWQAENGLGNGEMNGSGVEGYRVYQPSWDGGFDVGAGYDLFQGDGSYGGSEGFLKPSAQRTFNLGLGSIATLGGLSQLGALGGAADAAGTAATGAGDAAGLSAADLASMEMGMSVPAGADAVAAYGGLASPSLEAMAGAMGMTPEAFSALGAGGVGAAGAAQGMTAGTAAATGGGGGAGAGSGLFGNMGTAGKLATLAGGLLGSQEQEQGTNATRNLPAFLQQPVAGDLIPRTQGLLNTQMPQAAAAGDQMRGVGSGLLGAPVAGNGFTSGAVSLNAPTTSTNPYATSILDDLQRRQQQLTDQSLNQIAGRQVSSGGMGSTRQGVAQAQAISQGADNFTGQAANFMGGLYNQDQNRALSQYGLDLGFYQNQRGQDLAQVGVGSGLMSQGLQTPWAPLQNTAQTYQPFTGFGTASQSQSTGGGWQGALGGALGTAQLGANMGWWGGK